MRCMLIALWMTAPVFSQVSPRGESSGDGFALPELNIQVTALKPTQLETIEKLIRSFAVLDPSDDELIRVQKARMLAADDAIKALRVRWNAGIEPISSVLKAQENLAKAAMEALDAEDRMLMLMYVVNQRLQIHYRVSELMKVGARGGGAAAEAESRAALLEAYAVYLREKNALGKSQ